MLPITRARAGRLGAVGLLAVMLAACVPATGPSDGTGGGISTDDALVAASAPTTDFITMVDPVAESFTVKVPVGWDSIAYSSGAFEVHREVVSSISPDGGTVLFIGDPKRPDYIDPNVAMPIELEYSDLLEYQEVRPYSAAREYFDGWTRQKFSTLPDFKLAGIEDDPEYLRVLQNVWISHGFEVPPMSAVRVHFSYSSETQGAIQGLVQGYTVDYATSGWYADMQGLATNRNPDDYYPMLWTMAQSRVTSQAWLDERDRRHEETMAQMAQFTQYLIDQHNANMAWIQQSAANHQAHMQAVWAANDASMNAYYNNMASMDTSQQQFLNYINEEHTVAGPDGQTWQVTTGATNYYVNPTTGAYTGGDINFDEQDLIAMGYNPDDFVQVTIVS